MTKNTPNPAAAPPAHATTGPLVETSQPLVPEPAPLQTPAAPNTTIESAPLQDEEDKGAEEGGGGVGEDRHLGRVAASDARRDGRMVMAAFAVPPVSLAGLVDGWMHRMASSTNGGRVSGKRSEGCLLALEL